MYHKHISILYNIKILNTVSWYLKVITNIFLATKKFIIWKGFEIYTDNGTRCIEGVLNVGS